MRRLVEFPMQDGSLVLVQVEDAAGPVTRGLRDHTVSERAQQAMAVDRAEGVGDEPVGSYRLAIVSHRHSPRTTSVR